jgi:hypothetical protein
MKQFNLNKINIAHFKSADAIIGGIALDDVVYTDNKNACKTEPCVSINAYMCPNTTIGGEPTTRPIDTEPA